MLFKCVSFPLMSLDYARIKNRNPGDEKPYNAFIFSALFYFFIYNFKPNQQVEQLNFKAHILIAG